MKKSKYDIRCDLSNLGCNGWVDLHQVMTAFALEDDVDKFEVPIKYQSVSLYEVKELLKFYRQLDAGKFKVCFNKLRRLWKEGGLPIDDEIVEGLQDLYPEDSI